MESSGKDVAAGQLVGASMEPSPKGDGNDDGWILRLAIVWQLQWGHRLSAMATHRLETRRQILQVASMGPLPKGGGNSYLRISYVVYQC